MRRVFQARARRLFLFCAASACCFAITACGEDDGPVAGPIAGEMAAENYKPGDPMASSSNNSNGTNNIGRASTDANGDGILEGGEADVGGSVCAEERVTIPTSRSFSCSFSPTSNGNGTVDRTSASVQVEKKDSTSGRVLREATEDKPCGDGGEFTLTSTGSITICSDVCRKIKDDEDYDAVNALHGCL